MCQKLSENGDKLEECWKCKDPAKSLEQNNSCKFWIGPESTETKEDSAGLEYQGTRTMIFNLVFYNTFRWDEGPTLRILSNKLRFSLLISSHEKNCDDERLWCYLHLWRWIAIPDRMLVEDSKEYNNFMWPISTLLFWRNKGKGNIFLCLLEVLCVIK